MYNIVFCYLSVVAGGRRVCWFYSDSKSQLGPSFLPIYYVIVHPIPKSNGPLVESHTLAIYVNNGETISTYICTYVKVLNCTV